MALAAKTKKRLPQEHKKRHGAHQKRTNRFLKTYWPYIPMASIVLLGLVINTVITYVQKPGVLAYATEMSANSLLSGTNAQRTANGESVLNMNDQLTSAAQAKANDMVTRNYWSHYTPDGLAPWVFVTNAGYKYQAAGENLAYGFDTSSDTITGWMNSPEHRANILNADYQDVGFGVATSPNFVGSGPETIVVAEYGQPQAPTVAAPQPPPTPSIPAPATTTTVPKPTSAPIPVQQAPAIATTTPAISSIAPQPIAPPAPSSKSQSTSSSEPTSSKITKPAAEPPARTVARVELLTNGSASYSVYLLSFLVLFGAFFFAVKHVRQWHKVYVKSERFVMHHQYLDMFVLVVVMASFILTRSAGIIR